MLGEKIKWLLERCKASVSISVNNHKDNYESVIEALEDEIMEGEIDQEILNEMIKRSTIVYVHAYPDTPVGFYSTYHYDLESALDIIIESIKGRDNG
jgi:hypothetical protein